MKYFILIVLSFLLFSCSNFEENDFEINYRGDSTMEWVLLPEGSINGTCVSETKCYNDVYCYGLKYTPGTTGVLTSYTTGFFITCIDEENPVISVEACTMSDNSKVIDACNTVGFVLVNCSGNSGSDTVYEGQGTIIHQICFNIPRHERLKILEDIFTDLTTSLNTRSGFITEFPEYATINIESGCN